MNILHNYYIIIIWLNDQILHKKTAKAEQYNFSTP